MASDFEKDMQQRFERIEKIWRSNTAAYEQQLEQSINWYKNTNTNNTNVKPAPATQTVEQSAAPLTAQEVYSIAQEGGNQWQAILNKLKTERG
ncbi:MAG: hypothetical protein KME29_31375 [Calothrix sp. FI2-JRJ7]|jgi:hypothetical protein|nr:hypothetical protein [Calothrix sp. FI2-JRJ7]